MRYRSPWKGRRVFDELCSWRNKVPWLHRFAPSASTRRPSLGNLWGNSLMQSCQWLLTASTITITWPKVAMAQCTEAFCQRASWLLWNSTRLRAPKATTSFVQRSRFSVVRNIGTLWHLLGIASRTRNGSWFTSMSVMARWIDIYLVSTAHAIDKLKYYFVDDHSFFGVNP